MTRSQTYANRAIERVLAVAPGDRDDYKALVMKLPALLQQSGAVQTLVFLSAREGVGPKVLDDLAAVYGGESGAALRALSQSAALSEYVALTRDLIECAVWLRRFVQVEF